jgi:hypothetical protein
VALAFRFDAALADVKGVSRTIELREDETLADLHETIREAFGWLDDHLYSFWLDGRFWGDPSTEYTAPIQAEEGVATAGVTHASLRRTAKRRHSTQTYKTTSSIDSPLRDRRVARSWRRLTPVSGLVASS